MYVYVFGNHHGRAHSVGVGGKHLDLPRMFSPSSLIGHVGMRVSEDFGNSRKMECGVSFHSLPPVQTNGFLIRSNCSYMVLGGCSAYIISRNKPRLM